MKTVCMVAESGNKYWHRYNILHREDGPAIEWTDGSKEWYLFGKLHRADGPAIEYSNGHKRWHFNGQLINCQSQTDFEKILKLKVFW